MTVSRLLSFVMICIGGGVAIYAQADKSQNPYILIVGIVLLMAGVYRISRNIPSKFEKEESSETDSDEI